MRSQEVWSGRYWQERWKEKDLRGDLERDGGMNSKSRLLVV